jgi:hypothetical protein
VTNGATNFVAATADQVVLVQQSGTGVALNAISPTTGARGETTSSGSDNGVLGVASTSAGVGCLMPGNVRAEAETKDCTATFNSLELEELAP